MKRTSVLFVPLLMGAVVLAASPGAGAAPAERPSESRLIAQQNRQLDPQANEVDPVTGQDTFTPLPGTATQSKHSKHSKHGSSRVGAAALGDAGMAAAAAADPAQVGSWHSEAPFTGDENMVHVVCGPTGTCLFVVGKGDKFSSYVYDPETGTKKLIKTPDDLFCAGHSLLPDGRALVVGGTLGKSPWRGTKTVYAFDFVSETYEKLPDMAAGRWYPTVTSMSDGKQLITSGYDVTGKITPLVELFDPATDRTTVLTPTRMLPLYPRAFQTSTPGEIFHAGPGGAGFWNPVTGAFRAVSRPKGAKPNAYGSCFFGDVRDQTLMIMGGGWPAIAGTQVIDLDSAAPKYAPGPPMTAAKGYVSCVNLPDGTLFEANGGADNTIAAASQATGLLTTLGGPWKPMSPLPAGEHRLYHSLLYLQDDGRVVSVTSNPASRAPQSRSHLVFTPPYLERGPRPTITGAPTEVRYGGTYTIGAAAAAGRTVTRITVTTAPSATHSTDVNQRYLSLPLTAGKITFPTSSAIMPPGWYRIWAVDDDGVPSVAKWVHLT